MRWWRGGFPGTARGEKMWRVAGNSLLRSPLYVVQNAPEEKEWVERQATFLKHLKRQSVSKVSLIPCNSVKPWELSADSLIKSISFLVCSMHFSSRILVQSKNIYDWVQKVYWHFENNGNSLSTTRFRKLQKNPIVIFQEMYTLQSWPPSR